MRPGIASLRCRASSMVEVPTTLTVVWRVDSVRDWPVPVSAARWTTTSGPPPARRRSHAAGSVTSASNSSTRGSKPSDGVWSGWIWGCRLSKATTRPNASARREEIAAPMKPAPPVTIARRLEGSERLSIGGATREFYDAAGAVREIRGGPPSSASLSALSAPALQRFPLSPPSLSAGTFRSSPAGLRAFRRRSLSACRPPTTPLCARHPPAYAGLSGLFRYLPPTPDAQRFSSHAPQRLPTPRYVHPAAFHLAGSRALRPSKTTRRRTSPASRAGSSRRYSSHSVASRTASAPATAS